MKPSFSKFISILALFSLITPSSADYIRYSLAKITSIEPREWNDDNLMTILNIVSSTQNVTKPYTFDKWHRGRSAAISNVYKDFPLTGNEPVITASFGLYNVGDKDPQKYGLMITSLVLSIPSRIPGVGSVVTAIKVIIDLFKGAYECEGPVAVDVTQYTQANIQNMKYDLASCFEVPYSYDTQNGCVDWVPWTSKKSKYLVTHCIERRKGNTVQSVAPSSAVVTPVRSSTQVYSSARMTSSARVSSSARLSSSARPSSTLRPSSSVRANAVTSGPVSRAIPSASSAGGSQGTGTPASVGRGSMLGINVVLFGCIVGAVLIHIGL